MTIQGLAVLRNSWWLLLLRGIAAVIFGFIALIWPGLTTYALLLGFGILAIVDGILSVAVALRRRPEDDAWWSWLIDGILSVIIGLMAFFWPAAAALALVIWIAVWAIMAGILRIVAAIWLRRDIEGEWALGLSGLLLILWGALLIMLPAAGIISLTLLFGVFVLLIGAALILLALRLRNLTA